MVKNTMSMISPTYPALKDQSGALGGLSRLEDGEPIERDTPLFPYHPRRGLARERKSAYRADWMPEWLTFNCISNEDKTLSCTLRTTRLFAEKHVSNYNARDDAVRCAGRSG